MNEHTHVSAFVKIERNFFDLLFGFTGNIWFKEDVPSELLAALYTPETTIGDSSDLQVSCIGPAADYRLWRK